MEYYSVDYDLNDQYFVSKKTFLDAIDIALKNINNIKVKKLDFKFDQIIDIKIDLEIAKNTSINRTINRIQGNIFDNIYNLIDRNINNLVLNIGGFY